MADHVRAQIRNAAVALLTGLATTGGNVRAGRYDRFEDRVLPALRVSLVAESVASMTLGGPGRIQQRTAQLLVEIAVRQSGEVDDIVDQVAKEIEVAIAGDNTLGGLCKYMHPVEFAVEHDGEGDQPAAVGRQVFEVLYYTALDAPDVAR